MFPVHDAKSDTSSQYRTNVAAPVVEGSSAVAGSSGGLGEGSDGDAAEGSVDVGSGSITPDLPPHAATRKSVATAAAMTFVLM